MKNFNIDDYHMSTQAIENILIAEQEVLLRSGLTLREPLEDLYCQVESLKGIMKHLPDPENAKSILLFIKNNLKELVQVEKNNLSTCTSIIESIEECNYGKGYL